MAGKTRYKSRTEQLAAHLHERILEALGPRERRARGEAGVGRAVERAVPFLERLEPGAIRIRLSEPSGEAGSRTAIEVLLADQPFIVDTFRLSLRRLGLRDVFFLHLLLAVEREEGGAVARVGPERASARESYLYCELPHIGDSSRRGEIVAELERVLARLRDVVADHRAMVARLREHTAAIEGAARVISNGAARAPELTAFLDWLADDNYVFLGYRWYDVGPGGRVAVDAASGLGLMRSAASSRFATPRSGAAIPELVRARLEDERLLFFDKSRTASTIHREGRLDCVSVKTLDARGKLRGFGRFIGLLTHKAIRTRGSAIPVLRRRRDRVLAAIRAETGSHTYKAAINAFDSLPLEFLFPFEVADVTRTVERILAATERRAVEIAVVTDPLQRSFFVSAILPRERYDENLRRDLHGLLRGKYRASYVDHRSSFVDDEAALIHFFCTSVDDVNLAMLDELERDVRELAARWEDRLEAALLERHPERRAYDLAGRYAPAFPEAYRVVTAPVEACADVEQLERVGEDGAPVALDYRPGGPREAHDRLKIYQARRPYLTDLLPVLDHFGLRVVDATLTDVAGTGSRSLWIVTFRMEPLAATSGSRDPQALLLDGLASVLEGRIDDGRLNRLVLGAGLDWREVHLLRAYLAYARQLGRAPLDAFAAQTLCRYAPTTRAVLDLFRARLDPDVAGDRDAAERDARAQLERAREEVPTAEADRLFALLQELVTCTLRTDFFAPREGEGEHEIVLKLRPELLDSAPAPRPWAEVVLHSRSVLGVHLRGGPVARGGIRWSDRVQDLRTEILGLLKTQMVKNGLIVPVGAKGGFVLRRAPADPSAARAAADRAHARFMRALLRVTDDAVPEAAGGRPARVVARDGDDPYLVVAADKGTAHLSDAANAVARDTGFWLADAFASGGSRGYDHKAVGITARGAWACAQRHFLELGVDVERDAFSVAAIGDMSGDVFGNGLLLMRGARLLAAFNHLHVLVDPEPDAERAWAERKRLFELQRSSWRDYDAAALGPAGGVFDRDARSLPLTAEARRALGLGPERVSGEELVRAILRMPVDLLWVAGIGTYVKSSFETHSGVGDRANDRVRIDARELRARVVAEGGNLGLTQLARVEYALAGGRVNTDAIDNSGGVALSDREVNLKVLLAREGAAGRSSGAERDRVLRDCASDAVAAVLEDNAAQARCLSLDQLRGRDAPERFAPAVDFLVARADLDPELEFLPDRDALRARAGAAEPGYTRPELAILLGHSKLLAKRELLASDVPDGPEAAEARVGYFPRAVRDRFADAIQCHPLRREIAASVLANRALDQAGVTLVPELASALGAAVPDVIATYLAVDALLGADALRSELETARLPEPRRLEAALRIEEAVRAGARARLALDGGGPFGPRELERWRALESSGDRDACGAVRGGTEPAAATRAPDSDPLESGDATAHSDAELGPQLARAIARLTGRARAVGLLGLEVSLPFPQLAAVHRRIGEITRSRWLLERLGALERRERWTRAAADALALDVLGSERALTARIARAGDADPIESLRCDRAPVLAQIETLAAALEAEVAPGLAPLTVLAQQIRRLC